MARSSLPSHPFEGVIVPAASFATVTAVQRLAVLGHGLRESERQGIAVVWGGEATLLHHFLRLEDHPVVLVEPILRPRQVGSECLVFLKRADLEPRTRQRPHFGALVR